MFILMFIRKDVSETIDGSCSNRLTLTKLTLLLSFLLFLNQNANNLLKQTGNIYLYILCLGRKSDMKTKDRRRRKKE